MPPERRSSGANRLRSFLREAQERERAGCVNEALERYEFAVQAAHDASEPRVLAEALRRLAVTVHRRGEHARARGLGERSFEVARGIPDRLLAAEAMNTLGVMDLQTGMLKEAQSEFEQALDMAGEEQRIRARVEQNLGIVANIRGEIDEAFLRYRRSLDAYRKCDDAQGLALAHHNLGMACADRERLEEAERNFTRARALAERIGDVNLRALTLVNGAEVHVARQRYDAALDEAEQALALFDQLREAAPKSTAYRVIGMVYRETGRPELAESRLRTAIEIAARTSAVSNQAEASRELALLLAAQGRNGDALRLLNSSHRLFRRLDARADLVNVGAKITELERAYVAVVRDWGRSLEVHDPMSYGHSERVAQIAVAVARQLGLDEHEETTILIGAYLHDIGKVRVPKSILAKETSLAPEELEVARMHPVWGVELLDDVEFPWDLKPIIRWHHERFDGGGYPDRLAGDEIPLGAQIVGIAEAFDTLTMTGAERTRLERPAAVTRILETREYWSPRVVDAFVAATRS